MQIPILSGVYTDNGPDMRLAYPVNLMPTPTKTGISAGYHRPADGLVAVGLGSGVGRGGIEWRGILYRVMGSRFVFISAAGDVIDIGEVGEGGPVTFTYGFDYLAVISNGNAYLYDGITLAQIVDVDLGVVVDGQWIDGYYLFTDGASLIVTELTDPFAINPLKYGSSESDPDPVLAILRLRNEIYALNRNTIEAFDNIGGALFPFQRIDGAKINKGTIGTHACCVFLETLAFVGGGRNEAPGVYLGVNASATKISTVEIDRVLATFTEVQLATTVVETRNGNDHSYLYIHLPDRTLVYDATASQQLGDAVWMTLTTSLSGLGQYRGRYLVWCYDRWNVADPSSFVVGILSSEVSSHYGQPVQWEFSTGITYADGKGAIFNQLELVALTGRVALGEDPSITTSHSADGMVFSQERSIKVGKIGERMKRLVWFRCGQMRHWRIQRFRGTSDAHVSFARLEVKIEGLAY